MKFIKILSALLISAALAACAPTTKTVAVDADSVDREAKIQKEIAFRTHAELNERLQNLSFILLSHSEPICRKNSQPTLGMMFAAKSSFSKDFQAVAAEYHHLDDAVRILHVLPGSPAEKVGLKAGDKIISFNGQPIDSGETGAKQLSKMLNEGLEPGNPVEIRIERQNEELTANPVPVEICAFSVVLSNKDDVNAYANGKQIFITSGMMRFVNSDKELAMVISHELAHNAMGHIKAQQGNYWLGTILDIAIAATTGVNTQGVFGQTATLVYSEEFEAEADYVGLYIMARAGLDIEGAAYFWRRMAAHHPQGIKKSPMSSHPSTPERFVAIEETVKEIMEKQASDLPLFPNLKDGAPFSSDG